jgi:predicted dehydrogenase
MSEKGMDEPPVLRIGIVGAGENARLRHIPGLKAIEGVEIVSVCNRSLESSERVAKEFGIAEVFRNWQELVSDKDIDAVVIGTWPYMHCAITVAALEADKHVLCEARMASNAKEAHEMLKAARARPQLVAQVVPSPFTLRVDKTIKRLIAEGFIGKVLVVEVRAGGSFVDMNTPLHWRQNSDYSGLNAMSLGIWYESVMRWVGEAVEVTAMGKTFVNMRKDADGVLKAVRIPDHLDVIARMACGAQLHMQISGVTGLAGQPEVFVFGTEATLCFANDKLYGGKRGDKELKEIRIPKTEEGSWRVEEEFVNAIRGRQVVELTIFEDGVKYMEFTEAVARSSACGKMVPLPLYSLA